jgi:hypothetical protein
MKIKFDIDCTPEEARAFFGLPDVAPMQAALMKDVEARMKAALSSMDAEKMLKAWLPAGFEGFEKMQRAFWEGLSGGKRGPGE